MCNPSQGFYGDNCREPLSPAAQAVLDSVVPYPIHEAAIAAALRSAADQVAPREPMKDPLWASDAYRQRADIRAHLLAIAAELEAHHG